MAPAARSVSSAANRELSPDGPTVAAIWGNKIASTLIRFASRSNRGVMSEQTDKPASLERRTRGRRRMAKSDRETSVREERAPEQQANDEAIRNRAHEIYKRRGEEPGHEVDDWLEAEREIHEKTRG
jgi:hypothetical protein